MLNNEVNSTSLELASTPPRPAEHVFQKDCRLKSIRRVSKWFVALSVIPVGVGTLSSEIRLKSDWSVSGSITRELIYLERNVAGPYFQNVFVCNNWFVSRIKSVLLGLCHQQCAIFPHDWQTCSCFLFWINSDRFWSAERRSWNRAALMLHVWTTATWERAFAASSILNDCGDKSCDSDRASKICCRKVSSHETLY